MTQVELINYLTLSASPYRKKTLNTLQHISKTVVCVLSTRTSSIVLEDITHSIYCHSVDQYHDMHIHSSYDKPKKPWGTKGIVFHELSAEPDDRRF